MMELIKLTPVYKDYLWGGTRLRERYGKGQGLDRVAESWELAVHPDGTNRVAAGPDAGMPLDSWLAQAGPRWLGARGAGFAQFPVMVKLIDALQPLSIQVHPGDNYALAREGQYGKTEVWYILDALPGSFLYMGLRQPLTREELDHRIRAGTLTQVLNRVEVHPGEAYFIPAGTIHAIGAGVMVCEIQQNSNLTYRVYDYDRRDAAGSLRPLHLDQAAEVSTLAPTPLPQGAPAPEAAGGGQRSLIASCPYFVSHHWRVQGQCGLPGDPGSFTHLLLLEGSGLLRWAGEELPVQAGDSLLLSAGIGEITLTGEAALVSTRV